MADAFKALRHDLIAPEGPQISTMRNYRFAIVPYPPEEEFRLRQHVQTLVSDLTESGWLVRTISLHALLLKRIRGLGDDVVQRMIDMERRTAEASSERALTYLRSKLAPHIEGDAGIAADVAQEIREFASNDPDKTERTLAIVARAGALYPFFRTSSLLKHLDGKTGNVPVVLMYPGVRQHDNGLSFMGIVNPDRDYRPRIYP